MPLLPHDCCNALPEQHACIRVEYCMLTLREILSTAQYMELRREVFKWNVENEDRSELNKGGRPRKVL